MMMTFTCSISKLCGALSTLHSMIKLSVSMLIIGKITVENQVNLTMNQLHVYLGVLQTSYLIIKMDVP